MEKLRTAWGVVSPYLLPLLLVLLAVAVLVALVWWWRRRRQQGGSSLGAPQPMRRGRLLEAHQRFLDRLPWLHRAAVRDLPTAVVLGPAGSGKTRLIELDVDWQRQARQFLPSHTQDPLLQIYLGPDTVVQEVSAQLLADDSPQARDALRRLWRTCFSRQNRGLTIITLDVRWLADCPPDEVRRTAQLLRGKLNLISEVCRGPVETRLCLTHMDTVEGFPAFAHLLRSYAVPLSFEIPPNGEEGRLASLLEAQEQYLALGLTSLPVDVFERLERFYSQGGRSFAALARFVTALLEGGTLSFKPHLSRLYLSSTTPEAREAGVLTPRSEALSAQDLRRRYLRTHLRRCALVAAVCGLPVLAAYGNFYRLLLKAESRMEELEQTVSQLRTHNRQISGSDVKDLVQSAGQALEDLSQASRYWPPLDHSFPDEWGVLSSKLSSFIRETYLQPALQRCHQHPRPCHPEEVASLLAVLHASYNEPLGKHILALLPQQGRSRRGGPRASSAPEATEAASAEAIAGSSLWLEALNLDARLVRDYIENSDCPWGLKEERRRKLASSESYEWMKYCILDEPASSADPREWARWPYAQGLTLDSQMKPWRVHLNKLQAFLDAEDPLKPEQLQALEDLEGERKVLLTWLTESSFFASLPKTLQLLDRSEGRSPEERLEGIESTLQVIRWMEENSRELRAILRMEEELLQGLKAVEKMTPAELLTRDGLWTPSLGDGPIRLQVKASSPHEERQFVFRPQEHSRWLLQALIAAYERTGRMPLQPGGESEPEAPVEEPGAGENKDCPEELASAPHVAKDRRLLFETTLKPLVDEFTKRMKEVELSPTAAAERQEYVRGKVNAFSESYREELFRGVRCYRFKVPSSKLSAELDKLTQPSSGLVDVLRTVATQADLEPLEGPYYEPLRNAVTPFKPLLTLMTQDKSGNYTALAPYQALVAQLHAELNAGARAAKGKGPKEAKDKEESGPAPGAEAEGPGQLPELLPPLGKVALSMLLEEEDSYLRKVKDWLDQQGLIGDLRQPFLQPFLLVQELGKAEIEKTLREQWSETEGRLLSSMLNRYPFDARAAKEVDPRELEVLHRKDGAFWHFVERVLAPIVAERGTDWALRGPLRGNLRLPPRMLSTLSRLSRMSRVLWDEEGKPRPLMLQVLPRPLPAPPEPGSFVTMASLKCGKTAAFSYNQNPSWQDFPLAWWEQQTASIVLELRSPKQEKTRYLPLEVQRSSWSCFRLLEAAFVADSQHRIWRLTRRGEEEAQKQMEISFGVKGEPWAPFREVKR